MKGQFSRVKERKTYTDGEIDDDDIEGRRLYRIEDKLISNKYNKTYVKELKGEDFNLKYLQENGLQNPVLFAEKTGLGLRIPSDNFKVSDVKACVGSRRMLDVMDVNTQKGLEMSMKDWVKYFENPERDRLLNVISLEFSHTKLENYVESPNLVREVDWVDTAWPQHLKDCQTESTNAIDKMKYPKVQKYCLMSVAGCYTDFHIDFGGTSVWYHLLQGEKIFWLIPPTQVNLNKYENWVLSGKQGEAFLADSIDGCQMLQLVSGNTFIIPSGWIHAVYTPQDSLVFGGNFLHSFNMVNQLRVSAIEDRTHVPMKFRYPFYNEINWYVLERYVHSLTGVTYLEKPQLDEDMEMIANKPNKELIEEKLSKRLSIFLRRIDDTSARRKSTSDDDDSSVSVPSRSFSQASNQKISNRKSSSESDNSVEINSADKPKAPYKCPVKNDTKYVHLTKYELDGLSEVANWVKSLPAVRKGIPKDLIDPDAVLSEIERLIKEHKADNPDLAITGEPILEWTKATKKLIKMKQKAKTAMLMGTLSGPKVKGKTDAGSHHRRVRCKRCEPCTRDDCRECNFCKDMKKYGGPGRAKQSCISRQCLAPNLPKNVKCLICNLAICKLDMPPVKEDGAIDDDLEDFSSALMECGLCWETVHPLCLQKKFENLNNNGVLNEDLPNSWKCSKCCFDGKEGTLKPRVFKGGWRPNLPGTPPPPFFVSLPVHDDEENLSPKSSPETMVTEGKRVTVSESGESKESKLPMTTSSPAELTVDTAVKQEMKQEQLAFTELGETQVQYKLLELERNPSKRKPSPDCDPKRESTKRKHSPDLDFKRDSTNGNNSPDTDVQEKKYQQPTSGNAKPASKLTKFSKSETEKVSRNEKTHKRVSDITTKQKKREVHKPVRFSDFI